MNKHKLTNTLFFMLLILLVAVSCKGQTDKSNSTPGDSTQAAKSPLPKAATTLPDSTNLELAKINRGPRNIRGGYYIIIDKSDFNLSLYKDGILRSTYPVAIGKTKGDKVMVEDSATPEGYFNVKAIRDASLWKHDFNDGKGEISGAYGPWFISLNTNRPQTFTGEGWSGIGIHGTHDDSSIGKHISAGCIRLHNKDIITLKNELSNAADPSSIQVDILP